MTRILAVDDEEDLLMLVEFILDDQEVHTASTADAARAVLRAHAIDVLLLDISMPGTDGPTLLTQLRAEGLAPDVVFLVSAIPPTVLSELAGDRAVRHLPKPFTATGLRAALEPFL